MKENSSTQILFSLSLICVLALAYFVKPQFKLHLIFNFLVRNSSTFIKIFLNTTTQNLSIFTPILAFKTIKSITEKGGKKANKILLVFS